MLTVSNLKVVKSGKTVLDGLAFSAYPGDRIILSGESGCGKSTLIRSLIFFECFSSGEIRYQNEIISSQNIHEYRRHCVYVGQKPPMYDGTVRAYINLPYSFKNNCCDQPSGDRIREALSRFDLSRSILSQPYSTLSGGEQQRVTLIQGLLLDRPILLLDEVTSSLDPGNVNRVVDTILEDKKRIVIAVTHQERWQQSGIRSCEIREGRLMQKESP